MADPTETPKNEFYFLNEDQNGLLGVFNTSWQHELPMMNVTETQSLIGNNSGPNSVLIESNSPATYVSNDTLNQFHDVVFTPEPAISLTGVEESLIDNSMQCDISSYENVCVDGLSQYIYSGDVAAIEIVEPDEIRKINFAIAENANWDHNHFVGHSNIEAQPPLELIQDNEESQLVVSTVNLPSSLPASQNWSGDYGFEVSFSLQEKSTKGVSWTYSKILDKLYVGKDAPCPINFSTNVPMPENVRIRAMALYSSPESASEVVKRCENHSLEEKIKNIFEAEHLVRCECPAAHYEVDGSTKRHSVIVPFENPPAGQQFSTYIYKFTCFGSCPFGPNRRPIMLIFSLERGSQVIGRRKIDVKICACPGRDKKSDEQAMSSESGSSKKRKEPELVSLSETFEFTKNISMPVQKKSRPSPNQEGLYTITIDNLECYEFLLKMKYLHEMCQTMRNLPSDAKKVLANYCQKKGYIPDPDA